MGLRGPREFQAEEPLVANTATLALIADWEKARKPFDERDWGRAVSSLMVFLETYPGDKAGALLLERAQAFLQKPPSHDWDGVLDVTTK
jgi:hypothetical protein